MFVIVPDSLRDEINRRLDTVYAETPEAAVDREQHFTVLLSYFNEHGHVPSFSLAKKEA